LKVLCGGLERGVGVWFCLYFCRGEEALFPYIRSKWGICFVVIVLVWFSINLISIYYNSDIESKYHLFRSNYNCNMQILVNFTWHFSCVVCCFFYRMILRTIFNLKTNMNRIIKTLLIASLTLLFVGCQSNEDGGVDMGSQGKVEGGVEVMTNAEGEVQDQTSMLLEMQGKLSEIVLSGDVERCKELTLEQYLTSCEANILANRAQSPGDATVCDEASTENNKTRCINLVSNKDFSVE
jgi:hypothetical protein